MSDSSRRKTNTVGEARRAQEQGDNALAGLEDAVDFAGAGKQQPLTDY
jgi:hypothetical protein